MKIIDNALQQEDFLEIKNTMLKGNFPWYYRPTKVMKNSAQQNQLYRDFNFQFVHIFYKWFKPRSEFVEILNPILDILQPVSLVRIKSNLTTRCSKLFEFNLHQDIENFSGKTAIFYVNSNDGYTKFEDGTKVESIENRLIIFDSNVYHTGTTCTNRNVRCVINFNFTTFN